MRDPRRMAPDLVIGPDLDGACLYFFPSCPGEHRMDMTDAAGEG